MYAISAKAGIQNGVGKDWIAAFAGMAMALKFHVG
jgi:hypothetical protein